MPGLKRSRGRLRPVARTCAAALFLRKMSIIVSRFRRLRALPSWRRISLYAWKPPRDPTAYGLLQVDLGRALAYLEQINQGATAKVTVTHLVGKAIADAIALRPEVNAMIRRRYAIYQRDTIDVFFQVAYDGGEDLSGAKVVSADRKGLSQIAVELHAAAARLRTHHDRGLTRSSERMAKLPGALRGAAVGLAGYLHYDLGLNLSWLGMPVDAFGTVMVTNVGVFGLPQGFAPLVPFARAPIVLTVGALERQPWVVGDEVLVRPVLTIGAALDHRLLDGFQAGVIARRLRTILEDPEAELADPGARHATS